MPTGTFLALYRGERLIAVSSDDAIVDRFIRELSGEPAEPREEHDLPIDREPLRLVPDGGE